MERSTRNEPSDNKSDNQGAGSISSISIDQDEYRTIAATPMLSKENGTHATLEARSVITQAVDASGDALHVSHPLQEDDYARNADIGNHKEPSFPALQMMVSWSQDYRFPASTDCDGVREKADALPDMVAMPFEEAVKDIDLAGWEDLWVSKARYAGPNLVEPKIDFVYTCTYFVRRYAQD